jgi:hypothetical protein
VRLFTRQPAPPRPAATIHRAVTASARPVSSRTGGRLRRLAQPWQKRALDHYDTVGECWYPAQFYARALTKVRFFPAILDEKGDPQEVDSGDLANLFERIHDPGSSGLTELAASYGRLRFLTGDGYLTVTEDSDEEVWEYLSPLELRVKPDNGPRQKQEYLRLRAPGLDPEELMEAADDDFEPIGAEARVYRLWRRHPAYSEWADSPVRAVLDLYDLLLRLTQAASAESTSRAANRGGFYLPQELSFAEADAEAGGDEDTEIDIFTRQLTEAIVTALENPGDASAMSPIIVRGPGMLLDPQTGKVLPMKDAIGHFPIGPDRDYAEAEMWEKTIARISYGLDLPREYVTGTGDANHWQGWLLDEQAFRQHIAPVAQAFGDDLAAAYLRPAALRDSIPDADRVVIAYDPAGAINHPDEIKSASEAWDRGVVSNAYYLDKIGATEEDAPDEEELEFRLRWIAKKVEPDEDEQQEGETSPAEGGRGGDANEAPPDVDESREENGKVPDAVVAAVRIASAVEAYVDRARELAGNRLVSRSKGCDDCREVIADVRPGDVAAALGREQVQAIIDGHTSEAQLVAGAGERFASAVTRWGYDPGFARELGTLVERHALDTLYEREPPALPADLSLAVQKGLA